MNEREKISRYFSGSGNGELANRLLDLADQVRTRRPLAVSDFVSPYAGQIATTIRAHFPGLEVEEN
ncbi:MAG: RNA-binding protein, partial [Negativicoccus succinicivorans]|nr:RNA-binding protein [Negativicoccus succinicivorans]